MPIDTQITNVAMTPKMFVIKKTHKETEDTFTIGLAAVEGETSFQFKPGQFNMLYVHGCGEVPISICGNPDRPDKLIHTIRVVGDVTRAIRRLQAGDIIGVRGPFGSNWPIEQAEGRDIVVVTGGIGLAPLRPVVYHVLNNREKYKRISILYGTRTPSDIIFKKELESLRGRFDVDLHVTVDRTGKNWMGNVGVVTTLIKNTNFDPTNTTAFICGPEIMMRYTAISLQQRELAPKNIYVSLERNMKCGIGLCGHCQYTGKIICKDGPVFNYETVKDIIMKREI
ncbi:MAG: FAD/NAD(P)-binding protein [candidate division Zixibacteria bacterium]|nr:FAD/NAD(P)-binding protein [candidate division Zixibacteria bacterium]